MTKKNIEEKYLGEGYFKIKYGRDLHFVMHKKDTPIYQNLKKGLHRIGVNINYNGETEETGIGYILNWADTLIDIYEPIADKCHLSTPDLINNIFEIQKQNALKSVKPIIADLEANKKKLHKKLASHSLSPS